MKLSPRHRRHSLRGISLIECLAFIAVLGVLIAVGGSTLAKAWDSSRALSRNAQDIERAIHVGERWRADIRSASGRIEVANAPAGQSLRIPMPSGPVEYAFADSELRRRSGPNSAWVTVLPKVNVSKMQPATTADVTAWEWELELQSASKNVHVLPLFTFTAVPSQETTR